MHDLEWFLEVSITLLKQLFVLFCLLTPLKLTFLVLAIKKLTRFLRFDKRES